MRFKLYDRLKGYLPPEVSDLKIIVKTRDEDIDYRLSKNLIKVIQPVEEEARTVEHEKGKKIFFRKYKLKDSAREVTYKLLTELNACFIVRVKGDEIEIEDIECPPCERDAYSEIPENHYLLENGKIVEELEEKTYRVYTCKVKPPS